MHRSCAAWLTGLIAAYLVAVAVPEPRASAGSVANPGADVQEWVWDEGIQLWGGWRWDGVGSRWELVDVRHPAKAPRVADARHASVNAYVTAYTWYDNTPPGSAQISDPVLHQRAGGIGSYEDPLTVGVGHSLDSGQDVLDWPRGTRFYFPRLHVYGIVEDTCGDGSAPQLQPCHRLDTPGNSAPAGSTTWLDVWIDGRNTSAEVAALLAAAATGVDDVIVNPDAGLSVRRVPPTDDLG